MSVQEQPDGTRHRDADPRNQSLRKDQARELRESRAMLSGIISSAMDAIISVDANQVIKIFNAAAEKMFRCRAAEAIGQPLDKFIPPRYREQHRQHVVTFGKTGVTNRAMGDFMPLSGLRSDGEEFPIEASISQVEVEGEKIFTVILRDISARVEAEEQIRAMNAELENRVSERTAALQTANHELEGFTYTVAHDLRAPLRHMDAFSRILLEDYAACLPEEARQFLRTIRQSSQNLSRLVDDLLNLARIGRHELKRETAALGELVAFAVAELQQEAAGRKLEWRIKALPEVQCDPGLMKQVFVNLLSNAIKYTRPREVAIIEVGVRPVHGETAIYVRDNGVGFDMKYKDKLFGVFQRLHRTDEFEGTGVGLAIVDLIVRKHGGRVWAESAVEAGATFYFTLQNSNSNTAPADRERSREPALALKQ